MSDIHLEWMSEEKTLAFTDTLVCSGSKEETLILAGDICPIVKEDKLTRFIQQCCGAFYKVIYVMGNHEAYGTSIPKAEAFMARLELSIPNLVFLNNQTTSIEGTEIAGTTLWFENDPSAIAHRYRLNDFNNIQGATWEDLTSRSDLSKAFITKTNSDVWILHHAPSINCLPEQYRRKNDPLNSFFYRNLEALIAERKPKYVIHGHTHVSHDLLFGDTHILCNAKGYGEENMYFDMEFGFEI